VTLPRSTPDRYGVQTAPRTDRNHNTRQQRHIRSRRLLDVFVVVAAAPVVVVIGAALGAAVILDSGRPVLYRGKRIGRNGEPFDALKFRSMRTNNAGRRVTTANDERITRVGRVLRNWKLDELPQLLNVLRGDMSLVGPRPEDPVYVERYTTEQRAILAYRPGITSPASLRFRNEEALLADVHDVDAFYVNTLMPAKIDTDLAYFADAGALGDIALVLRTLRAVIFGRSDKPVDSFASSPTATATATATDSAA
jgi:lipopolysaccharide/colanic/teichoic acid biosynthesis glycosyltransferase